MEFVETEAGLLLTGHFPAELPLLRAPPAACRGFPGRVRRTPRPFPSSTVGAKGRKLSRNLIFRFMTSCIFGERASPMMERLPEGPGSEFHASLEPADHFLVRDEIGDCTGISSSFELGVRNPAFLQIREERVAVPGRSEVGALHAVRFPRRPRVGCPGIGAT